MHTDRETARIVRSWLEEGRTALPDHIRAAVLDQAPATPQRRSWWPAWRFAEMNTYTKLAVTAATVLVVGVVGYNLLPSTGDQRSAGGPAASPTLSPTASPSLTPTQTPLIEPHLPAFLPKGPLAIGRHTLPMEGIPMSFDVTTSDWISNGAFGIDKAAGIGPNGAGFIFWQKDANGVFTDPCHEVRGPVVGPTAADMATAIAAVPGIDLVSGPSAVRVGGRPAQYVVITIPDDIGCRPDQFYLWYDDSDPTLARYATGQGSTIRVWIVDVDGKRVQIDGETYEGAGPEPGQAIQRIIDSIKFE
jgi:hypothetical protein